MKNLVGFWLELQWICKKLWVNWSLSQYSTNLWAWEVFWFPCKAHLLPSLPLSPVVFWGYCEWYCVRELFLTDLLLVCRKAIDFCKLFCILPLCENYWLFLDVFWYKFWDLLRLMSHYLHIRIIWLPICSPLISSSCFLALPSVLSTVLKISGDSSQLCLVPDFLFLRRSPRHPHPASLLPNFCGYSNRSTHI